MSLAEDGIISRNEAIMRVEPRAISELLHRQIDPDADRILGWGCGKPRCRSWQIVFSAEAAQAHALGN